MSNVSAQTLPDYEAFDLPNNVEQLSRPEKRRKVLLLGAADTGKSAFLMRYKQDTFLDYYEPTIHSIVKDTYELNKDLIEIEFIDIGGLTEYSILPPKNFAFGVSGYIYIYSITDRQSFELIKGINTKIQNISDPNIPKLLIGTKNDLTEKRQVTWDEAVEYASQIKCLNYECSAKTGYHIEKSVKVILAEINKYDNKFKVSDVQCLTLIKFFMRRNYLRNIFFCLCFLCIVCSILFCILTYSSEKDICFEMKIGLIFTSSWQILFSILGMIGINGQKTNFVLTNFITNILSIIFIGALLFLKIDIFDNLKWIGLFTIDILCLCIMIFFGFFYYRIFKNELYSYII